MTKTVKFNMRFGEKQIRSVEDLQENFFMDDVMVHFESGLLRKFLERRGYSCYVEKIDELSSKRFSAEQTARELVSIFDIGIDKATVDEYAEVLRLRREDQARYDAYVHAKVTSKKVIDSYFEGYSEVLRSLIDNKNELGKIKADTRELLESYSKVLEMDWRSLYFKLQYNDALYPICHMLTNDFFRLHWLVETSESSESEDTVYVNKHLVAAFKNEVAQALDDHPWIKRSNKVIDNKSFEDVETVGKMYIILHVPGDARVRPPNDLDNEKAAAELNGAFKTFNGIQYRHNSKEAYLSYAEV